MTIKFSLTRILVVIGLFSVPIALLTRNATTAAVFSLIAGIFLLPVALLAKKSDLRSINQILGIACQGVILGLFVDIYTMPADSSGRHFVSLFWYFGGVVGCIYALFSSKRASPGNTFPDPPRASDEIHSENPDKVMKME